MNYRFVVVAGMLVFFFNEMFVSDAFAYLDPGTGSALIQSIIGALVAVGIALKIYWTKIKYSFLERRSKSNNEK